MSISTSGSSISRIIPGITAIDLGKGEDAVHATGDTGVSVLTVRQAANAPLSGSDGDYEPLQTDANGHLKVNVIDALPSGTNAVGKLAANSGVDIGDIDVTSVIPGTGATALGKAEDAGHTTGDTGVMLLGVRNDANAAFSGTNLDYTPISVTSSGIQKVEIQSPSKTSYSASVTALAPAASATDVFEIAGSGTKTIKVTRLQVSGTATAAGAYDFVLLKRSTANSAGTSTSPTVVPHDSNDAAGTSVVKAYTANPTTGTLVGNVRVVKATVTTSAGAIPNVPTLFLFGEGEAKEIVLSGTAQSLCLNLNAATMAGGSLNIDVEWTEE